MIVGLVKIAIVFLFWIAFYGGRSWDWMLRGFWFPLR